MRSEAADDGGGAGKNPRSPSIQTRSRTRPASDARKSPNRLKSLTKPHILAPESQPNAKNRTSRQHWRARATLAPNQALPNQPDELLRSPHTAQRSQRTIGEAKHVARLRYDAFSPSRGELSAEGRCLIVASEARHSEARHAHTMRSLSPCRGTLRVGRCPTSTRRAAPEEQHPAPEEHARHSSQRTNQAKRSTHSLRVYASRGDVPRWSSSNRLSPHHRPPIETPQPKPPRDLQT